jgi:hypothetical protein
MDCILVTRLHWEHRYPPVPWERHVTLTGSDENF